MSYVSDKEKRAQDKTTEARKLLVEAAEAIEELATERESEWKVDYIEQLRLDAIELRKLSLTVRKIEARL